jgi:hypothetical protein
MKRVFLTTVAILVVNIFYAQWSNQFYVDDFGEPTNNPYEIMISTGTFSNTATQNSKLSCKFVHDKTKESLLIYVYEYGSNLANSIKATFENVKLKAPDGEVYTFSNIFFSKGGVLLFSKKSYTEISKVILQKGEHIMIFNRTGDYSSSSYKIKFTIE